MNKQLTLVHSPGCSMKNLKRSDRQQIVLISLYHIPAGSASEI
jgi:hypothetical protein